MKKCTYCVEEIQDTAVRCKHCGSWLHDGTKTSITIFGMKVKVFLITSITGGYMLGIPGAIAAMIHIDEDGGPPVLILTSLLILYALVIQCFMIHRLWKALQGRGARTTPARAVGFLFIPFYNYYWIFQAIWGWTVDFNRYRHRKGLALPDAPEGLAITVSILVLFSSVPGLGIIAALVMAIFFCKAMNRVNELAKAGE